MGKRLKPGDRSGSLVMLRRLAAAPHRKVPSTFILECLCEMCGKTVQIYSTDFRRRQSCVECAGVRSSNFRVTHGATRPGSKERRLYGAWQQMRGRCENPNTTAYAWYGAKGIKVCPEWQDFPTFRAWALSHGYALGMSLDRLDATKDYSPDNCEYVTKLENSRRMREQYVLVKRVDLAAMQRSVPYDEPWFGDY